VPRTSRAFVRRCALVALATTCVTAAACGRRPKQLSLEQYALIQERLAAQAAQTATEAPDSDATTAARGVPGESPVPPRDDAERRARATKALPPGAQLGTLQAVGDGTRWALALATARRGDDGVGPNLVLFDVSSPTGVLLGEHDFGLEQPGPPPPTRLQRTFLLDASPKDPVVLGELLRADDAPEPSLGACGWWLRRRKAAFLCAPRLTPDSRYDVHQGQLVESWSVDSVGSHVVAAKAGRQTGRKLRFVDGRWQETDNFRCLGRPLEQALAEAGRRPVETWQRDGVRRLTQAATRAADQLETDVAIARLHDALAIDGCASDTWRILGRLEFQAGRPEAAATLAVALALAPRDDAVMLDLADAVATLDPAKPAQRDTWHSVVAVLGSRGATRVYVDGGVGGSPRSLAATLYRTFLDRTSSQGEWLTSRRRKVEDKLAALEAPRAERRK